MGSNEVERLVVSDDTEPIPALVDARESRLEELRRQVESGNFTVSAWELASEIIDEHTKP